MASPAIAETPTKPPTYELRLGGSAGTLIGVSKELVYVSSGSTTLLSELDWAMEPLPYWGLRLDLSPADRTQTGFVAGLSLKSGIAGKTGTITDTDWGNGDGVKTHFSAHDCHTEQALLVDLRAGWRVPIDRQWTFTTYAQISYAHFRWTARDGYLQYGPNGSRDANYQKWSSSFPKESVYGTGLAYEQRWFYPSLGSEVSWASGRWSLLGGFSFAPWVFCADQDDHYLRQLQFDQNNKGGFAVEPSLEADLALTDRLSLSLTGSWRLAMGLRGDTTQSDIGNTSKKTTYPDSAGTELSVLNVGATFSVKL